MKLNAPHMPAAPPRRRRRGRRLAACAVRVLILVTACLLTALVVCGGLYVGERLFATEDTTDSPGGAEGAGPGGEDVDEAGARDERSGVRDHDAGASDDGGGAGGDGDVVVLDAGHGGVQSGCEVDGVLEEDITLAVTLLVRDKLEDEGVTVILTRETDEDVSLDERCRIANEAGAALFVSIHCNSYAEDTSISGFEGYYHNGTKGKRLAEYILDAAGALGVRTRNVKDENYQVIRDTVMPAALMEIGFLTNEAERHMLQTADYQDTIARAVADGVMRMLDNAIGF